jgi:uncharacterized protein
MKSILALTIAAFALAGAFTGATACGEKKADSAPAVTAAKGPGLWRVGDADTTVYLFGTVHVLPPQLNWRTPAIDRALGEAKAVYFETDINPDPAVTTPIMRQFGQYEPSDRLSDHLKKEDYLAVSAAATKLGVPAFLLNTMRPWLAALTLSENMISNAGYEVDSGVERKLEPMAKAQSKEIRKLETVQEQLMVFADLPEAVQVQFLVQGVKEMDDEAGMLGQMVNAWSVGDTSTLERIMIEQDLGENPEIYKALLVDRNANWVVQLDKLVKSEPGTFFVAVGAAHLTGKDSVLEKLKPLGYTADRIE